MSAGQNQPELVPLAASGGGAAAPPIANEKPELPSGDVSRPETKPLAAHASSSSSSSSSDSDSDSDPETFANEIDPEALPTIMETSREHLPAVGQPQAPYPSGFNNGMPMPGNEPGGSPAKEDLPPPYPGSPPPDIDAPFGYPNQAQLAYPPYGPPAGMPQPMPPGEMQGPGTSPPQPQTVQPQPQTTTTTVLVAATGDCPNCRIGTIHETFTLCGICMAIWFFPFGFLCLFLMRGKRCTHCGAVF